MYLESMRFNKSGTLPLSFQTEVDRGCPSDCPIRFADSGHQPDGYSITLDPCATMLDAFVAAEGVREVVMFSRGSQSSIMMS